MALVGAKSVLDWGPATAASMPGGAWPVELSKLFTRSASLPSMTGQAHNNFIGGSRIEAKVAYHSGKVNFTHWQWFQAPANDLIAIYYLQVVYLTTFGQLRESMLPRDPPLCPSHNHNVVVLGRSTWQAAAAQGHSEMEAALLAVQYAYKVARRECTLRELLDSRLRLVGYRGFPFYEAEARLFEQLATTTFQTCFTLDSSADMDGHGIDYTLYNLCLIPTCVQYKSSKRFDFGRLDEINRDTVDVVHLSFGNGQHAVIPMRIWIALVDTSGAPRLKKFRLLAGGVATGNRSSWTVDHLQLLESLQLSGPMSYCVKLLEAAVEAKGEDGFDLSKFLKEAGVYKSLLLRYDALCPRRVNNIPTAIKADAGRELCASIGIRTTRAGVHELPRGHAAAA